MKTKDRLTRAYEEAEIVEFDSTSKFIFFSDQHRGDGSNADEFSKNKVIVTHALAHYLDEGFTLVEIGDSEDLWEFPHLKHIVRAHGIVYGKLREFHTGSRYLRLFGNHDIQFADPRYVRQNLFDAQNPQTGELEALLPGLAVHQALRLRHKETGQEVLVVHGHQGDLANDQNWRFTMWTYRLLAVAARLRHPQPVQPDPQQLQAPQGRAQLRQVDPGASGRPHLRPHPPGQVPGS